MDIQDIYRTGDRNVLDALEFERFQKPETMKRFVEAGAQKNYLVTGANRGIVHDFTKQILQAGHNVYAACRNTNDIDDLNEICK